MREKAEGTRGSVMDRRSFFGLSALTGAAALTGGCATAGGSAPSGRLLRFGVLSDVHVTLYTNYFEQQHLHLEKALRWMDGQGVDAVVFPGDMIHSGIVSELEIFADVWHRVFPGGRGHDGRKVEHVIVTGNHEIAMWKGRIRDLGEEKWKAREGLVLHAKETWRRLFGEEYEKVFVKKIKGIVFVGAQYMSCNPPIEKFFTDHAAELPKDRPFFFVQHAHPAKTCYGTVDIACDAGQSVRALSPFPNAVALTGHSHSPLTDDRSVWQGAFTSIGCGSMFNMGDDYREGHDNATVFIKDQYDKQRKESLWLGRKGYESGRNGLLVDVYADHLDVRRRSFDFGAPLGPDWRIPLPAAPGGPFDFQVCARTTRPPEFGPHAKVYLFPGNVRGGGYPRVGPKLRGKPYVSILFPVATAGGSRVYEYVVTASVGGKTVATSKILSNSLPYPPAQMQAGEECNFGRAELLAEKGETEVTFEIVPRNCYGVAGKPLVVTLKV